jgi:predicted lipoprotein with Yx(FWY)xxD motif
MRSVLLCCAVSAAALVFDGCSGNSGSVVPGIPAQTTTLGIEPILGAPGFYAPNGAVVYSLSSEKPGSLICTVANSCVTIFTPLAPPNFALTTGFTTFVRSDNGQTQLAYLNAPLYTYSFDPGPGAAAGNNLVTNGSTWTVARP